jgi:hypothetical protein
MAGGSTRRRFLKRVAYSASGAIVAGAIALRFGRNGAASFYRRLVELPPAPVVEIEDAVSKALRAATATLLPSGIDENRYDDFFRHKSKNVLGYGRLYARFRDAADARARRLGAQSFEKADPNVRDKVLAVAGEVRDTINRGDRLGGARLAVFDREWLLFERYLVREILTLFSRTDAWLLSGYGPHPGVPRGLDLYTRAPGATE